MKNRPAHFLPAACASPVNDPSWLLFFGGDKDTDSIAAGVDSVKGAPRYASAAT